MIQGFSKHLNLTEAKRKDTAVFAFGRMNPPTIGHGVVVDKVIAEASKRNGDHFVFVSKTQDAKKNPLTQKQKVTYLKKFFPRGNFPLGKTTNPFDTVLYLCELGYKHIVVVTGSDHIAEYNKIKEYKGKVASNDPKKRSYSFETLEVVVAGQARDDSAQGVAGMSASKMRAAAFSGDFKTFSTGVPGSDNTLKKQLYNDVRKGLALKEEYIPEAADESEDVTILALTSSKDDLSDTVEKMEAICKRRKISFHAVKTSSAQIDLSNVVSRKITIKNYDGEGKDITIVPGDTVAVVRGGVMNSEVGVAILTILQNNGVFMINERGGMELCANKLESAIALKKHELPHPRTAYVAKEENIETAVKEIGNKFPVIVKTLTGAEGIGVSKIESMESLKSVLQTLWKFGAEVIIQEFLPDFKNDVRSIVLNGRIFACAKRDKAPKDFRTNIARGSKGGSFQLSDEEIKLVEQAARVSKCYYVGIDHVVSNGKPYIIEMNASPGSGNIYYRYYEEGKGKDNVKGEELVEDFVDYITNKAHWKLFAHLAVREKVKVDGREYTAKIDTGNSGYNMMHGDKIKDNGDHTVSFTLPDGKRITKKIVSRITVKSGIGEKKRLVVLMDVEFHGKKYPNIKFSIGDRSHMSTKVLFGLQFLSKTGMVVDPADAIFPQPDPKKRRDGADEEEEEQITEIIRHMGNKWVIFSKDGKKKLGTYGSEAEAKKRLRQIEFFKRQHESTEMAEANALLAAPKMLAKVMAFAKKAKSMPKDQLKSHIEKAKTEIIYDLYKASGVTISLAAWAEKTKIGSIIAKFLDKIIGEGGVSTAKIMKFAHAVQPAFGSILDTLTMSNDDSQYRVVKDGDKWMTYENESILGIYDTEAEAHDRIKRQDEYIALQFDNDISEADVTKGKEFKTKTGKTKESPKDKGTGLPKKYVSGMSKKDAELRKQRLAKRKAMPDDDPKTWEFVNPSEKGIKTKPSKYSALYKKLAKKGKLKALKNGYENDEALERIMEIAESNAPINDKMRMALKYEESCIHRVMPEAAQLARAFIDGLKEERYGDLGKDQPVLTIDDEFALLMLEVSPPTGPARRFSKKEKVKREFQKRYGKRWKEVFYATAWKMHGEEFEPTSDWLEESKKINDVMQWTALGKRGPLLIATDEIVRTYKYDTPGERERLKEEDAEEEKRSALYKEWEKLVNMSGKEIDDFLDSEEGEEAGLSRKEAGKAGAGGEKITSGRDSARAIVRMLDRPMKDWSDNDWKWAGKQVNFINRMKGAKGDMRDEKGRPTRKLLALKVWGHNPEKKS